jgi:hypothetical protein
MVECPPKKLVLNRGRNKLDRSRRANREDNEKTVEYRSREQVLLDAEKIEEKLPHLLAFILRLERTPPGAAELKLRTKSFGECKRLAGETSEQFYGRLRYWLDRSIPRPKSARQAKRQHDFE